MIKAKAWKEVDLVGKWYVNRKLDGIRMLRNSSGEPVSRNGKPLWNLDGIDKEITDAEVFAGSWEATVSAVKKFRGDVKPCAPEFVYSLTPGSVDPRLELGILEDPSVAAIEVIMNEQIAKGDEGLILRSFDDPTKWLKVKTKYSADVRITGLQAGGGKYTGMLGAFVTNYGNVGTGLTDLQRKEFDNHKHIGSIIEVEFMEWTNTRKMRHPRFKRIRSDKDTESFE